MDHQKRNPSTSGTSQSAARDKYNVCTPERVARLRRILEQSHPNLDLDKFL